MSGNTQKPRWLTALLITALAALFAWTLVWRVPGFAGLMLLHKVIWFTAVFAVMAAVFIALRQSLWGKLDVWRSFDWKNVVWQRLIPLVVFGGVLMALFTYGSDYFDSTAAALWLSLSKIIALLLVSVLLILLITPLDLLQRGKVKSLRLHTFLTGLVIFAFAIAFANSLTPVPSAPPLSGAVDALHLRLPALHFDGYLVYLFTAAVLAAYFLVKPTHRWLVLLIASYGFLFTFDPAFPLLLLAVTLVAYLSGRSLQDAPSQEDKKKPFRRGALSLIAILLFFKYAPLLWSNASVWLGAGEGWRRLLLPLGLSFYSFTALSYLMDVRAGKLPAVSHFGNFALYLAYFPKLLIGPIERPKDFFEQLSHPQPYETNRFVIALTRISIGLVKKLVIANRLAVIADTVFAQPVQFTSGELLAGLLAFSFQVYIDFSAYCDIAIGLSQLFGIRLSENFEQPYLAPSIAEFWRRWHITFSQWLRDYVFLPLEFETRRVREKSMQYINVLLTFLVSGMWHGATLNFLVWGGLFGVFQIGEDLAASIKADDTGKENGRPPSPFMQPLKVLLTFALVALAWVFFRADSYPAALSYLEGLFNLRTLLSLNAARLGLALPELWLGGLMAPLVLLFEHLSRRYALPAVLQRQPLLLRCLLIALLVAAAVLFAYHAPYRIDFVYSQF